MTDENPGVERDCNKLTDTEAGSAIFKLIPGGGDVEEAKMAKFWGYNG